MSRRGRPPGGGGGPRRPPQPGRGATRDQPPHADASSDEEEPEGDDLFGDDYLRDYEVRDSDDDVDEEELRSFIDTASDVSELSDHARAQVGAMLDQRHRVERAMARRARDAAGPGGRRHRSVSASVASSDIFSGGDAEDDVEDAESVARDGGAESAAGGVASTTRGGLARSHGGAGSIDVDPDDPAFVYREGDLPDSDAFDWTKPRGEITDWLAQDSPRRIVRNRIFNFLLNFTVNGSAVYVERVRVMTRTNQQSFEVSYVHLGEVYHSILALWLIDVPDVMLEMLNEAANYLVYNVLFPHYHNVHRTVRVRIAELPLIDPIRGFRQIHRDILVRVQGVVIRRSPVYPQLQAVRYDCQRCSHIIGPVIQRSDREVKVTQCPSCQSKGPFRINMALTEYRNHQTIVVQEPPGQVPPGRLPRSLEAILTHDLIDRARPGESVEIIGTYKNTFDALLNSRQGFPVFTTVLVANNVTCKSSDVGNYTLPEDERQKMLALSKHPRIKAKLVASMAPSIHGRDDIKLGLLLSLLGGVPKDIGNDQSHKIRGDINVLLVGDPGTAKSQCLKFVEKIADRAVFTTGRGSTAVGLTASVSKDPVTGDFTLEGGALVIADRGVCLIDEFDKMSDVDRTSIHEAMEQQTISVARGGIVTTLSARCSIIAASNPIGGRYDPSIGFDSNVDLTTPILSRFDLLFVIRDEVNTEADAKLAKFICQSHQRSHPAAHEEARLLAQQKRQVTAELMQRRAFAATVEERDAIDEALVHHAEESTGIREDEDPSSPNPLPQATLKKYILYAKSHCRPMISRIDGDTLARVYTDLRQESKKGGIPITVRHMESIIRLSEAHARMHLRDFVTNEDVNSAIGLFLRCFLSTQKYRLRQELEAEFRKFLEADIEPVQLLHHRLKHMVNQARLWERRLTGVDPVSVDIECADFEAHVLGMSIAQDGISAYYQSVEFRAEFDLVYDDKRRGVPVAIRHTLIDA